MKREIIYKMSTPFGKLIDKRKKILFIAPFHFHGQHIYPVIKALYESGNYLIHYMGPAQKNVSHFFNKIYSSIDKISPTTQFDLIISTEVGQTPWWTNCPTAYFGHGVGPKLSYQTRVTAGEFDYSLCPSALTYDFHRNRGITSLKVGLPILDQYYPSLQNHSDSSRKTIVYAPSWHKNIALVNKVESNILTLAKLKDKYKVIVSPHPNLFITSRCQGRKILPSIRGIYNEPDSNKSTLELCSKADFVISDISSIFFESAALGKKVFLDGNSELFRAEAAESLYDELTQHYPIVKWNEDIATQLESSSVTKSKFIESYIYNIGTATCTFIEKIEHILNGGTPQVSSNLSKLKYFFGR